MGDVAKQLALFCLASPACGISMSPAPKGSGPDASESARRGSPACRPVQRAEPAVPATLPIAQVRSKVARQVVSRPPTSEPDVRRRILPGPMALSEGGAELQTADRGKGAAARPVEVGWSVACSSFLRSWGLLDPNALAPGGETASPTRRAGLPDKLSRARA